MGEEIILWVLLDDDYINGDKTNVYMDSLRYPAILLGYGEHVENYVHKVIKIFAV